MDESAPARRLDSGAPATMGKYSPFARLDGGGMADVFVAVSRGPSGFNKLVVIKRLRNAGDPLHVRMFLDEARLSARLSHPNVVNTYEVGETNGNHFMAMEYLDGQPLEALLPRVEAVGGLSEALVAFIAVQTLKALHYAHELCDYDGSPLGIVHRDVSPQNVFLTFGGEVKLIDFGIAKATVNVTRTETGVLKGKIRYMAPEQVGEGSVDRRVDLFALGIVMWEMLAQRTLFDGDSYAVISRIGSADAPSVRSVRPSVSVELDAIVARALRRDPSERYATAAEMQADLERFLRGKLDDGNDTALARVMNRELAEKRDKVRDRIKAFLAGLDTSSDGPTELGAAADMLPPLLGEGSAPRRSPLPVSNPSLRPSHTSAKTALLGRKGRPRRFGGTSAAAILVVMAAIATFVAFRARTPVPAATIDARPAAAARVVLDSSPTPVEVSPSRSADRAIVVPPVPSTTPSASPIPTPPRPQPAAPRSRPTPSAVAASPSASAQHIKIRVLDDTP